MPTARHFWQYLISLEILKFILYNIYIIKIKRENNLDSTKYYFNNKQKRMIISLETLKFIWYNINIKKKKQKLKILLNERKNEL